MSDYDKTTRVRAIHGDNAGKSLIIFCAGNDVRNVALFPNEKIIYSFGRETTNDIVLSSKLVSRKHGNFQYENNLWSVVDLGSTNGVIHNGVEVEQATLAPDDFIRIDDGVETVSEGVLIIFAADEYSDKWESISSGEWDSECNLNHISPDIDASIERSGDLFYLNVRNSNLYINKKTASGRVLLHEKDVIACNDVRLVFTSTALYINRLKSNSVTDSKPMVQEDSAINNSVEENLANHIASTDQEENPSHFTQDMLPVVNEQESYDSDFADEPVNNEQIQQDVQYDNNYQNTYQNNSSSATSSSGGLRSFLASDVGYYVLSFVIAIIIWGIAVALWTSQGELALIVILACAIFGWQALNSIQPAMFIWMSWTGWIIYFCVKFILSAIIGLFVAPFKIGKLIAGAISGSMM